MEVRIIEHNRNEFVYYAIVKNLLRALVENTLAIQIIFNIAADFGARTTTIHKVPKAVYGLAAALVGNGFILVICIDPLADILVVGFPDKRHSLAWRHRVFFVIDFCKMRRKRVEDSCHALLRENPDAVIGIGVALGIANYTNPVFVGLEQDKVEGGIGVVLERQQGICDTLEIIRPHLHLLFCEFHYQFAIIYRLFNPNCQKVR